MALSALALDSPRRPTRPHYLLWACLCVSVAMSLFALLALLGRMYLAPYVPSHPHFMPWAMFTGGMSMLGLLSWMIAQQERQRFWMDARVEQHLEQMGETATILAEKENKLRAVVDHAIDGLITINNRGNIESFNPACERIFGYSAEEVMGQNIKILMPEPYHSEHDGYLRNYFTTGQAKIIGTTGREVRARRKDGSVFPMDLAVSSFDLKDGRHFSGIIRDITERKQIERMKDSFISIVSHELRTPLTSIRGSIGLMRAGIAGELNPKLRDMIEIAHKNCERLILLINDILDIDKIESGEMRFDLKDEAINPLVQQAIEANRAYGEKFGVRFMFTPLPSVAYVYADSGRLMQVLSNLLSNAAKFSPPGSQVEVAITRTEGTIRVSVRDYGGGIAKEFHTRIFQKFAQADASSTRLKDGTGLGLHITQQLIQRMHGEVGFLSEEGKGSTFWVDLPDATPHSSAMPWDYLRDSEHIHHLPRLLLIGNDDDLCRILIYALQGKAIVDAVFDTPSAAEMLKNKGYHMLVASIAQPSDTELELLDYVMRNAADTHLLIINHGTLPDAMMANPNVTMLSPQDKEEHVVQHILTLLAPQEDIHGSAA